MDNENKHNIIKSKYFLIPFIILTIIFIAIGSYSIKTVQEYFFNDKIRQAQKIANSYSYSFQKSNKAKEIINHLMEQKLTVAGRIIVSNDENNNNKFLAELKHILELDVIHYYNKEGVVTTSSNQRYIGWSPDEAHPISDFINSDKKIYIEDIRPDTESGIPYKFGYYRDGKGNFIQIGILANTIQSMLNEFKISNLLEEINRDEEISQVCYINNDFTIQGSTNENLIGNKIGDQKMIDSFKRGKQYSKTIIDNGVKYYQVYVPIVSNISQDGYLAIRYSLDDTYNIIYKINIIGVIITLLIYGILLYILKLFYDKNKNLTQLAYYDNLTGLPNKDYLKEFLSEKIKIKDNKKRAIFLINFNNFGVINLSYGYKYGDQIINLISKKLEGLLDKNIKLFRFTADRCIIYSQNYKDKNDLIKIVERIENAINSAKELRNLNNQIYLEIGIVEINDKYDNIDKILTNASITISHINNGNKYEFFNDKMEERIKREDIIEKELREVINGKKNNSFYLKYQPIYNLATGKIAAFEALARMNSKEFGNISPVEFIDIAEKRQLIIPLSELILKKAIMFSSKLDKFGLNNINISINISGIQLLQNDFTDKVISLVKKYKANPENIKLEITESILLDNFELINKKLEKIRNNKIKIVLDDFGTGYSSFYRLKELNLDALKIDRSFINKITTSEPNKILVDDIISMGHKLDLKVVAEGVELEEEKQYLIKYRCDAVQGYLYSKSVIEKEAIELLKKEGQS